MVFPEEVLNATVAVSMGAWGHGSMHATPAGRAVCMRAGAAGLNPAHHHHHHHRNYRLPVGTPLRAAAPLPAPHPPPLAGTCDAHAPHRPHSCSTLMKCTCPAWDWRPTSVTSATSGCPGEPASHPASQPACLLIPTAGSHRCPPCTPGCPQRRESSHPLPPAVHHPLSSQQCSTEEDRSLTAMGCVTVGRPALCAHRLALPAPALHARLARLPACIPAQPGVALSRA